MLWMILIPVVAAASTVVGLAWWSTARLERSHRALAAHLVAQGSAGPATRLPDPAGLPAPVQRYLAGTLPPSGPLPRTVRLTQAGEILQGGRWRPFTAVQHVAVDPPGFVWDAKVSFMPLLAVQVVDRYVDGSGGLVAKLAGTLTVAREEGSEAVAVAELMRFLAELPWLPTTAVGPHVAWRAVDANTAEATLRDAGRSVTLTFSFDGDGDVVRVEGERPRSLPGGGMDVRPWVGRFWDYRRIGGVRLPTRGEVAWVTPDGPEPYWRGRIVGVFFDGG